MPETVIMEYEYHVVAGRGNSSATSLAESAHKMAKAFYGDLDFTVHVEVRGKTNEFFVQCVARAEIEVNKPAVGPTTNERVAQDGR